MNNVVDKKDLLKEDNEVDIVVVGRDLDSPEGIHNEAKMRQDAMMINRGVITKVTPTLVYVKTTDSPNAQTIYKFKINGFANPLVAYDREWKILAFPIQTELTTTPELTHLKTILDQHFNDETLTIRDINVITNLVEGLVGKAKQYQDD